jgi:hypothetical protein
LFNPDFKDMLSALSEAKTDFLLVGLTLLLPMATLAQQAIRISGFVRISTFALLVVPT